MGPKRWIDSRPDRAELCPCCICDVKAGECRDGGFVHTGRRWEIGITWPGDSWSCEGLLDGVCRATVEDRYVATGDDEYDLSYRGACCGCGWACEREHLDSNTALEDALDHSLPAWRRVPVVDRHSHDAPSPRVQQWLAEIGDLYRALGLEDRYAPGNGGLIRTLRQPFGTRSHWSGGFFDVCAGLVAVTAVEAPAVQLGLF